MFVINASYDGSTLKFAVIFVHILIILLILLFRFNVIFVFNAII